MSSRWGTLNFGSKFCRTTGIERSDGSMACCAAQGRRNKPCLARVLALQFHPLRTFELNYKKKSRNGQFFIFTSYFIKRIDRSDICFYQGVPRSILNNIRCRYSIWVEYLPKITYVFCLRTSGNHKNRQISYYWYVWGQPRSVASDDL